MSNWYYVGQNIASTGLEPNTAWFINLRGAASVAFGAALSHHSSISISPVLTFNNWPAEFGIIPAEETLAALVQFKPKISGSENFSIPVFLFDAWRIAYREEKLKSTVIDNRYFVMPHDLPSPQKLQMHGITRIIYLVENLEDSEVEEDDLNELFIGYQKAGIELVFIDLLHIYKIRSFYEWNQWFETYRFTVLKRETLVEDPRFYEIAHGCFAVQPLNTVGLHHTTRSSTGKNLFFRTTGG